MIELTTRIDPRVSPVDAFKMVGRANGKIAAHLRFAALDRAAWNLVSAEWIRNGPERHRAIKRQRDQLKEIRKLEIRYRGWRR